MRLVSGEKQAWRIVGLFRRHIRLAVMRTGLQGAAETRERWEQCRHGTAAAPVKMPRKDAAQSKETSG